MFRKYVISFQKKRKRDDILILSRLRTASNRLDATKNYKQDL